MPPPWPIVTQHVLWATQIVRHLLEMWALLASDVHQWEAPSELKKTDGWVCVLFNFELRVVQRISIYNKAPALHATILALHKSNNGRLGMCLFNFELRVVQRISIYNKVPTQTILGGGGQVVSQPFEYIIKFPCYHTPTLVVVELVLVASSTSTSF